MLAAPRIRLGARAFEALNGLIGTCPAAAIDYPDTDGALDLVETLWEAAA